MDERKTLGLDGPERGLSRNGSGHLTEEEGEALAHEAVLLRAEGLSYREVAARLGVNKNTVPGLIAQEYDRRKATRDEERAYAISVYRGLQRDAWKRLSALPVNSSSQSVSGMHASIRQAQERIDKITGIEAPTRTEHKRVEVDLSKLPDEDAAEFFRIVESNPDVFAPMLEE